MKIIVCTSALMWLCLFANAQSIQVKDLAGSVGGWEGNLTYLDYPSVITLFEVYASQEAYQSHTQAPHFKKYKEAVKDMVLSLELIDAELVLKTEKADF